MSKFKVGDEVRLMESVPSYEGGYSIGDTGAIINAPLSCENWVKLKGDEDVLCGYLKTSALELVEPKVVQDKAKRLLKGANIGAAMMGDVFTKSQEAELTTRYGDRYKQYIDVATKQYNCRCTLTPTIKEYPNPPHKHKDLIIAWANGADIEFDDSGRGWHHMNMPSWYKDGIYRIKLTQTPLQLKIEKCEAKLAKLKGRL